MDTNEERKSSSLNRLLYPLGTIVPAQILQFQNIILPFERNEQIVPEHVISEQQIKQGGDNERLDKDSAESAIAFRKPKSKRKRKRSKDTMIQDSDILAVSTCISYIQGAKKHLTDLREMLVYVVDKIPSEVPNSDYEDLLLLNFPNLNSKQNDSSFGESEPSMVSEIYADDSLQHTDMNTTKTTDMSSYLKWLPSVLESSRIVTASTIGRVVHMISSISTAFPKVVKNNIKQYILHMPLKWSSFSFLLPSYMLAPRLAIQNVIQMSKLVADSIAMLVSIETTVIEYIKNSYPHEANKLLLNPEQIMVAQRRATDGMDTSMF